MDDTPTPRRSPFASQPLKSKLLRIWRDWQGVVLFVVVMLVFRSAVADWNQAPSGSMKPGILAGDRIVVDKLAWDLRVPFTDRRIARWSDPARGDIVTFENPLDGRLFIKRVVAVPGDVVELRRKRLTVNGERAAYTPLDQQQIDALPIEGAQRYRFYREQVQGVSRVVMMHADIGGRPDRPGGNLRFAELTARQGRTCSQYDAVAADAGRALAAAVCRCANAGHCDSLPPFTVPPGKYWMMGDYRDNSSDSRVVGFVDRQNIYGRAHAIAFSVGDYYRPRFDRFFTDLAHLPRSP